MKFAKMLADIARLEGRPIRAIRKGAEITVLKVSNENIKLKTSTDQIRTRPTSELMRLWDALLKSAAIHVDSVLGGSGTSRNQPETLLANLPYIEYLYINNKKHLTLMPEPSHPIGTIRESTAEVAKEIKDRLEAAERSRRRSARIVIISPDVRKAVEGLSAIFHVSCETLGVGVYKLDGGDHIFYVVASSQTSLSEGTYPVLAVNSVASGTVFHIDGVDLWLSGLPGVSFLLQHK